MQLQQESWGRPQRVCAPTYSFERAGRLWRPKERRIECIGGVAGGSYAARGLARGGEWSSGSIASLISDFDSRFSVTNTGNGTPATGWSAHSGLAYNASPPSAGKEPTYETGGWTALTSGVVFPSLLFDGVDDSLVSSGTVGGIALANRLIGGTDQPGTIFLVLELVVFSGNMSICSFTKVGLGSSDQRFAFAARSTGSVWRTYKQDDTGAGSGIICDSAASPDTSKHVLGIRHSGTNVKLDTDTAQVINASQNNGAMTVDRVELGATYGGTNGNIRLVRAIFCSAELSDDEFYPALGGLRGLYL